MILLNKYLPYSILVWIVAVVHFVRSMLRQNRFVRNFSIVLNSLVLVKLFVFEYLDASGRSLVYLVLGLFLIGFASIYPKLLKEKPFSPEFKRAGSDDKLNSRSLINDKTIGY